MENKKIAFILYEYPLGVSMMIVNTIALLRRDNEVVVFIDDDQHILCDLWLQEIIVSLVPWSGFSNGGVTRLFKFADRIRTALIRRLSDLFSFSWETRNWRLFRFARYLHQRLAASHYDMVVAVESLSLIAVAQTETGDASVIYFDMELLDWSPDNPLYVDNFELKKRQHEALLHVDHVMITSQERANVFAKINQFDPQSISVLPVVPLRSFLGKRSRYFREKFAISDEQFIVVYAGNFMPWAQCIEIITSMGGWPLNAVLVMHTWNQQALKSRYFNEMREAAYGRPVFFSSGYLLPGELSMALTSADAGLLFYEGIDSNFTEICFSSNKMGEYVAAGLPVIASPFPSLKSFIEQQGIGRAVPIEEIGDALREISGNKDIYRQSVKKCAATLFSFEDYFSDAWARFEGHSYRALR